MPEEVEAAVEAVAEERTPTHLQLGVVHARARADRRELQRVDVCEVEVDDLYAAREIISFGGGGLVPIVEIDGRTVGSGEVGPVYNFLRQQLVGDVTEGDGFHDDVPYHLYE